MDDKDRFGGEGTAAEFRERAARARAEAEQKGLLWWGYDLLIENAEYFERRAAELEAEERGRESQPPRRAK